MNATNIKIELLKRGIKVTDIARFLGVAHPTVSTVLHGKRTSLRVSKAIALAIDLPLSRVFPRYKGLD